MTEIDIAAQSWIEEKTEGLSKEKIFTWILENDDREDFEKNYASEIVERTMGLDLQNNNANNLLDRIHNKIGYLYFEMGGKPTGRTNKNEGLVS